MGCAIIATMPSPSAITISPVSEHLRYVVLALRVQPAQEAFVGSVEASLLDAEQCPGSTPVAFMLGDQAVGYARIERNGYSVIDHPAADGALGLRSFFIDHRWQGRGLGLGALHALLPWMVRHHPHARAVVLTVNCRNTAALALYRRAGFVPTGALYHGGPAGPQQLLVHPLPP